MRNKEYAPSCSSVISEATPHLRRSFAARPWILRRFSPSVLHSKPKSRYSLNKMSGKPRPFIIDKNLSPRLKDYLPGDGKTTIECGLPQHALDNPDILDLCQRENAMLVTADEGFITKHIRAYQRSHNDCCWGVLLLPNDIIKQINLLQRLKEGKIKLSYPKLPRFTFDLARHDNLLVDLRTNPPAVRELCGCPWYSDN